jgi:uncharacterized protein
MKIVLDTNVIIASFAAEGICHALFELCIDQHKLFICDQLINEVSEKLKTKLKLKQKTIKEIVHYIEEIATSKNPPELKKQICRDHEDDIILSLSETAKADYLITGDNDLLVLRKYKSIPIITPREFWEILRKNKEWT